MTTDTLHLTAAQVERADWLRALLTEEHDKVISGKRRRPRAIKVGIQLTDRCDKPGIEGRLKSVSTTGAIVVVRDAESKLDVEVANVDIVHVEIL